MTDAIAIIVIQHRMGLGRVKVDILGRRSACPLWVISGHLRCKKLCPLYPPIADMKWLFATCRT
jgi:hypothetical protein